MKTIIFIMFIISISIVVEAQTSLKITNGVLKLKENTALNISSDLIVESGAYLKNDGYVEVKGNIKNSGNSHTIDYTTAGVFGKIKLSGSSEQIIYGTTPTTFENLALNNTNATGITLRKSILVNKNARFTDGIINSTSTNLVKFLAGSSVSAVSNASHVSGPLSKTGSTPFDFPVGKSGIYRNAGVYSLSASETYTAEYFDTKYPSRLVSGTGIAHVGWAIQSWTINRLGLETATVLLSWNPASLVEDGFYTDLIVARFDGSFWISNGGNAHTGDFNNGTVKSDVGLSSFGDFTLGSKSSNNPLPVELLSQKIKCVSTGSILTWTTASELNNDFFTVEKSEDMLNWKIVTTISGAFNSNNEIDYSEIDSEMVPDKLTYYRLKQTDFDGQFKYFDVLSILCSFENNVLDIIGLNVSESNINLIIKTDGLNPIIASVTDMSGKTISIKELNPIKGANIISLDVTGLSKGIYIASIHQNGQTKFKKIYLSAN